MTPNPNQQPPAGTELPNAAGPGIKMDPTPAPLPPDHPSNDGQLSSTDILNQGVQQPGQEDELTKFLASITPGAGVPDAAQQPAGTPPIQAASDAEQPPSVGTQIPGQTAQQQIQLTPEQQAQVLAQHGLPYTSFDEMKTDVEFGNNIKNDPNALRAITGQYAQNMGIPQQQPQMPYQPQPQQPQAPPYPTTPIQQQPIPQTPPQLQPTPQQQGILDQMPAAQRNYFEAVYNEMQGKQGLVRQDQVQQMITEAQNQTRQEFRENGANSFYENFFEQQKPQIEALGLNVEQVKLKVHQAAAKHGFQLIMPNSLPGLYKEAMIEIPGGIRAFSDNQQQTALGNIQQKRNVTVPIQPNTQNVQSQPRDLNYYMQPQIRAQLNSEQLFNLIQAYNKQQGT